MKRTLPFLLLLSLLLLGACTKGAAYEDGIPCAELLETAEEQIPVPFGYDSFGAEQIDFYFGDTMTHDDAAIRHSKKSEDINEIGIFHAPDEKSRKEIEEQIERYLSELRQDQSAFIGSYAPDELPKLENAEWRSFGNYTAYAVLDEKDRTLFFESVEKALLRESE